MNLERAKYILACVQKEKDELEHRIMKSAPNDAIKVTGAHQLKMFNEQIASARKLVEERQ